MKKYALGIVALVLAIGFSGFTIKKRTNKSITVDYKYTVIERKITNTVSDPLRLNIIDMVDVSSWSYGVLSGVPFGGITYLRAIQFNQDVNSDNGIDGGLSKQEAINAVETYFVVHGTLPISPASITVNNATVILMISNSN